VPAHTLAAPLSACHYAPDSATYATPTPSALRFLQLPSPLRSVKVLLAQGKGSLVGVGRFGVAVAGTLPEPDSTAVTVTFARGLTPENFSKPQDPRRALEKLCSAWRAC
jgi:hypothetical protein